MNYLEIKPTILICILAFDLLHEKNFRNTYSIRNDETNSRLCDDMQLVFLELPKFKKAMSRPMTGLERWLFYFATEEGEEMEMMEHIAQHDPAIAMARLMEREFWANEYERELYFAEQKRIMDEISAVKNYDTLIKMKYSEGEANGIAFSVNKMLEKGISATQISKILEIPISKVRTIARQNVKE